MFTLMNAKKLILDMGMATILLAELGVSVLGTFSIVGGEMEEKTSTLLLSKPVSRFTFLLAKVSAVSLGLLFVLIPLVTVLIMTLRMGVPEAAYSEVKYSILWFELIPLLLAVILAGGANYYADKNFGSAFVISLNISIIFSLFLLYFILEKRSLQLNLFLPASFLWMAGVVISPIASLFSLRGKVFFTLTFSFLIFLLGLTSSYLFGKVYYPGMKIFYSLIPNFQIFWIEEAWVKGESISIRYLASSLGYMFFYTLGMTFLGWSIWERKEISGGR